MAFFDTTWYCNFGNGTSTGWYAVPLHAASTAYVAGQIVRQFTTPAVGNERCFVCIVAGTSAAATDATWVLTRGAKTTDGTITWMECTGATAMNGDLTNTQSWAQVKAVGSAVTLGQIIKRNNGASYQVCTLSSGNTGAAEPAFSDTPGATTVDGSATWTCLGLVGSFSNGGAPHARLASVFVGGWFASGNTVYVGDNHAETQASSMTFSTASALLAKILCHNHSGSYPPAAGDITAGALVTVSGSFTINFTGQGSFYYYGIVFQSTAGAVATGPSAVGQTQNWYCFDNCSLQGTSISLGASSTAWAIVILNNTTVKFTATTGRIIPYFMQLIWQNTGSILASGSSVPTTLFQFPNNTGCFNNITLTNLDLSQLTGSLFTNVGDPSIGTLLVQDCKLNAAMTVTTPINSGMRVEYLRSDSAGTSYKSRRIAYEGIETTETTIVRTGGAVDPSGQAQSRKIVTSATAEWLRPYKAEPLAIWNPTVGSPITVTVCGTVQSSALPYNDELWMEVEYLGDAASTLGTIVSTTKANLLAGGTSVATDSSVWGVMPIVLAMFDGAATSVTLSNGNLTVTHPNTVLAGVASTMFLSAGKFYFEVTPSVSFSPNNSIGVLSSTNGVTDAGTVVGTTCVTIGAAACTVFANGVNTGKSVGGFTMGNVFCVAIDLNTRQAWFRVNAGNWNGDATANPATGIGGVVVSAGTWAPWLRFINVANNTDVMTANFGQSTYVQTVPPSFGNWHTGG